MKTDFACVAIAVVLAAALLAQTWHFRQTKSITNDETFYLSCALQTVHDGWLDERLAQHGVASLPVLLAYVPALLTAERQERPHAWQGGLEDPALIRAARAVHAVVVGLPLLLTVYLWLLRRRGLLAAALAGSLVAFSPSLLAHTALATTDGCFCLFALLALAALAWYGKRPTPLRLLLAAAAAGAALAAKYSAVFLFPVALLVWLQDAPSAAQRGLWRDLARVAGRWFVFSYLALLCCWALHGFSVAGPLQGQAWFSQGDTPGWMRALESEPLPAPVVGILYQYLHNERGHPAYLLGQQSQFGWWYYFPCAVFFKSTPVELLLLAGLPALLLSVCRRRSAGGAAVDAARPLWLWSLLVFGLLMLGAQINIGQRYVLLLYPLLFLAAVDWLWSWAGPRSRLLAALTVLLLVGQAASALWVAPNYLAYFTPLVGGPSQGRHYLLDSNLDWGQDLPQLRGELQRLGAQRVVLKYFGKALPEAYGVEAQSFDRLQPGEIDDSQFLAISVNYLQGMFPRGRDPFGQLREREAVGRAGYSILIYDLRDPRVRQCLQ